MQQHGGELVRDLLAIERSLWTNNAEIYQQALLTEAVLIFPVVGRISRDSAVAAIREENKQGRHWADVRFEDVSTLSLATDAVLLSYRSMARWNDGTSEETLCSTIYLRCDGSWKVASHQQTAV